jgi:spore germination protein GerM
MIKWLVMILLLFVIFEWSDKVSATEPQVSFITEKVYFYNQSLLGESIKDCFAVYPVERSVLRTNNFSKEALQELFKGPTEQEMAQGYVSFFSDDTKNLLISSKVEDRTAYINLRDFRNIIPTSNNFCGKPFFLSQVDKTVKQFGTVEKIIYAIEGKPKTFYDWMLLEYPSLNFSFQDELVKPDMEHF